MNRLSIAAPLLAVLSLVTFGVPAARLAHAVADGPDFYRVAGVRPGSSLNLRAGPSLDAPRIAAIPAGANGLRNLGCEGGMTFAEYSAATPGEREAARRTRWCQVEFEGRQGWVAGWFLAEGGPPEDSASAAAGGATTVRRVAFDAEGRASYEGSIEGYGFDDYHVDAVAGDRLTVTLERSNRFHFFNVLPPGSETAVFTGAAAVDPQRYAGLAKDTGRYTVRLYLMRNAARRDERSDYRLVLERAGPDRAPLAGYVPANETDFDATGWLPCGAGPLQLDQQCGFGVYRGASTVTVHAERPGNGAGDRILVFDADGVRAPQADALDARREGDEWRIVLGEAEAYRVPDAVLTGG